MLSILLAYFLMHDLCVPILSTAVLLLMLVTLQLFCITFRVLVPF